MPEIYHILPQEKCHNLSQWKTRKYSFPQTPKGHFHHWDLLQEKTRAASDVSKPAVHTEPGKGKRKKV